MPLPLAPAIYAGGVFPPAIAAALAARKHKTPLMIRLDSVAANERQMLAWLETTAMAVLHDPWRPSVLLQGSEALEENLRVMDRSRREARQRLLVPPPCERASWPVHALYYDLELRKHGAVSTFTLRLSHDRIAGAIACEHGFGRALQDYIAQHLKRQLGFVPDFWFVVEADPATGVELHLHGAIRRLPQRGDRDRVQMALRHAAGMTASHGFESSKLRLAMPFNLTGWSAYATKGLATTRETMTRGRLIYATQPVRDGAKHLYMTHRCMMSAMPSAKGRRSRSARGIGPTH